MSQEKLQILNMVKEGKITVEEGLDLLEALGEKDKSVSTIRKGPAKCLRVKVFDPEDETKINVTLPVSLMKFGVKFVSKLSPEMKEAGLTDLDLEEILAAVDSGEIGKIVDIDSNDGTRVEVIIE